MSLIGRGQNFFMRELGAIVFVFGVLVLGPSHAVRAETVSVGGSPSLGLGALGRIEPRSRVVNVSHDSGPEGARIEELKVVEGQRVKAGDIIAVFSDQARRRAERDSTAAQIEVLSARIESARAEEANAQSDYDRALSLIRSKAISEAGRDAAQTRLTKASAAVIEATAELKAAQAALSLKEEQLKQSALLAPMDGTVIKIHAWPGERVGNEGVVDLADLMALDVVAEIYEADIPKIKEGQKADIRVTGSSTVYQAEVRELGFQVRKNDVNSTDPLADKDTRVVEVRLTLLGEAITDFRHQIYRQVQVHILP